MQITRECRTRTIMSRRRVAVAGFRWFRTSFFAASDSGFFCLSLNVTVRTLNLTFLKLGAVKEFYFCEPSFGGFSAYEIRVTLECLFLSRAG